MDEEIYVYLSQILQCGHSVLNAVDEVMSASPEQYNRSLSKLMRSIANLNDAKFELFKHQKELETSVKVTRNDVKNAFRNKANLDEFVDDVIDKMKGANHENH